eukprot:Gregarina_sp_Poly_1__3144@NODE_188_length_11674_cov_170_092100_g167_i0_p2_GENE_NODE_188_length_11674_cov_170_092100_g167_i0NODE_188_length_11674_cov_170_092100_g167_i0_p2_ORF_typecomplete_len1221_score178_62Glyco_transf_20/PF00982_21/2_9e118Trehalose_PPase/PF02358_16/1_6e02Trehalose_PPase/PF02358_16/1_3e27Glycos_transf_1/PF00534_20/1_3e03Glycos_transf_1/PF00534_20/8_1e03Glycos_transf_1/PF00534_20/0_00012Glycos_transf_1/PF00534_20/2_2e03Glyco_trans_1_4/PF13692_6/0_012Glyco_trans_1_4/PF13692_6/1_8
MKSTKHQQPASAPILDEAGVPRHLIGQLNTEWTKVVRGEPDSRRWLQAEIDKLRLKWSRLRAGKDKPELLSVASATPQQSNEPGTLFVVFRRLPLAIRYSSRREVASNSDESNRWEAEENAERFSHPEDGHCLWRIARNKFNIDFSEALAQQLPHSGKVVLVGDPGVDIQRITDDAEAQDRLFQRLTMFLRENDIVPVWLTHSARKERYSEELLYPLFHYRTPPIGTGFSYLDWPAYVECNETFASRLSEVCKCGDWILVFNYHLMLVPQLLRRNENSRDAVIHFYVPTVFPSSEMYRILPQREELLKGILSANVISFHSHQYRAHFMTAVTRVLGVECTAQSVEPCVESGGTGVRVCVTPLGVEIKSWESAAAILDINALKERFRGRKVILGVDTLDYTKGLPQKMTAFRKFLTSNPFWATKVVFLQLCFLGRKPSIDAGHSSSYRLSSLDRKEILTQVFQVSGHINSSFGTVDHLPVHFLVGTFSVQELLPVYAMADIGLMTALRESISTSIYQFVLCQKHTNRGVIILSEFSGSAQMLGAAALQVNPWNINAVAAAIADALTMPENERNERHELAYQIVTKHDPSAWARQIISDFREAILDCDEDKVEVPPPLQVPKAVKELVAAKHVFIVTGIKETLLRAPPAMLDVEAIHPRAKKADYNNDPEEILIIRRVNEENPVTVETPQPMQDPSTGSPTALTMARNVEQDINSLASISNCSVIIVSSSSVPAVETVLQNCPNVHAFAENGHYYRQPGDQAFLPFTQIVSEEPAGPPCTEPSASSSAVENGSYAGSRMPSQDGESSDPKISETVIEECLTKVQELIDYFAKRTPGSYMRKTETSISWHYGNADKGFASNQARDLLFHLWSGPLVNNSLLELCVGKTSVEVRSCKQTKAQVVEWTIKEIIAQKNLSVNEIGVLCIGNYLPRDEEIYHALNKIMGGTRRSRTTLNADSKSPLSSRTMSDAIDQRHLPRCFTCTVGVRFSKAAYRLDNKHLIAHLLRRLNEALIALEFPQMTIGTPGSATPSRENFAVGKRVLPASPSVDIALAMATPDASMYPARRQGDYYKYLPSGRAIGDSNLPLLSSASRVFGSPNLSPNKSTGRMGRKPSVSLKQEASDVEEEDAEDEEEMFVLGASQALNVPNSIPFTHARPPVWTASLRPASVSPRWMTGHAPELLDNTLASVPMWDKPSAAAASEDYMTPFSSCPHTRHNSSPSPP